MVDVRQVSEAPALKLQDAHPSVVNNVRWHANTHWLMTTGNDPVVKVFDLRKLEAPLLELKDPLAGRHA